MKAPSQSGTLAMRPASRHLAGVLLLLIPTIVYGGYALLDALIQPGSAYMSNPLRQNLWRAGHAHAGVLLILSLVILMYVDHAQLNPGLTRFVRLSVPAGAILHQLAMFLSVAAPDATAPNALIYLAYLGAIVVALGTFILGVGLLRSRQP